MRLVGAGALAGLVALAAAQAGGVNLTSLFRQPRLSAAGSARIPGGINVAPSMRPWRLVGPNPDGWWCVAPNCYQNPNPQQTITTELKLARNLGVHVVRVEFPWFLIEPSNGVYDFSRADFIVNAATAAGVQLQPVLVYTPSWAAGSPNTPPSAAAWSSFVRTIVGRYPSIHYWEMWNEPDLSKYFAGSEATYVTNILVPGYQAAKTANANAQVIMGGPSGPNTAWADGIYSLGGGNSFDIMAFHDYGGNPDQDATQMKAVLQAHSQVNKPLWLGEYGVQENSVQDPGQQALMTSVLTSASPLSMAIWYNLRDDYSMSGCCSSSDIRVAAFWGLVQHDDSTLKQGYSTMQQLLTGGGSVSPSPSPSPSSSPSPSPIASPSPSPTTQPSPSPSPKHHGHQHSPVPSGGRDGSGILFSDDFTGSVDTAPSGWAGNGDWMVRAEDGNTFVEHEGDGGTIHTGSPGWSNYNLAVSIRPTGWASEKDGLLFAYQDGAYYSLDVVGGDRLVLGETIDHSSTELGEAPHAFESGKWYRLEVGLGENSITATIDGLPALSVTVAGVRGGMIGLEANDPAAFAKVVVGPGEVSASPAPAEAEPTTAYEQQP